MRVFPACDLRCESVRNGFRETKAVFGYGAGAGAGGVGDTSARGEGGGGGGGIRAIPVGVIEVSDQQARFVPITDRKRLTGAVLAGIGLGMFLSWRRRRKGVSDEISYGIT